MFSYLIRRLFQSIFFVLISGLLIYTLVVSIIPDTCTPGRVYDAVKQGSFPVPGCFALIAQTPEAEKVRLEHAYKLDKPWPLDYAAWLFDPSDTTSVTYTSQQTYYNHQRHRPEHLRRAYTRVGHPNVGLRHINILRLRHTDKQILRRQMDQDGYTVGGVLFADLVDRPASGHHSCIAAGHRPGPHNYILHIWVDFRSRLLCLG